MSNVPCPVCDGTPRVLVAIRHPAMRRFTRDLLEREYHCWVATEVSVGQSLEEALARSGADLVVVDGADFPECCRNSLAGPTRCRAIVIDPEPDTSYRHRALAAGASDWIPRERVGEELGPAMRRALGCIHDPCPSPSVPGLDGAAPAGVAWEGAGH